jgi:hypothetical protein
MIKAEVRSLIKGLLPRMDKVVRYHPNLIDAAISRVLGELYNETFADSPLSLQGFTKGYGYATALAISTEASTGIYYVTHPTQIIALPDKASGVRRVSTMLNTGMTFFPTDRRELDYLLSGSYANTVNHRIGYIVTPTRTEFYNMTAEVLSVGVRMDLIVPFSSYLDTDVVLIPENPDSTSSNPYKRQQAQSFTDRVLQILGVIRPIDTRDDNAEAKVTTTQQ